MEAMDFRSNAHVILILITQTPLPGDRDALARHFMASRTLG